MIVRRVDWNRSLEAIDFSCGNNKKYSQLYIYPFYFTHLKYQSRRYSTTTTSTTVQAQLHITTTIHTNHTMSQEQDPFVGEGADDEEGMIMAPMLVAKLQVG
jgi:hypothetical protein